MYLLFQEERTWTQLQLDQSRTNIQQSKSNSVVLCSRSGAHSKGQLHLSSPALHSTHRSSCSLRSAPLHPAAVLGGHPVGHGISSLLRYSRQLRLRPHQWPHDIPPLRDWLCYMVPHLTSLHDSFSPLYPYTLPSLTLTASLRWSLGSFPPQFLNVDP